MPLDPARARHLLKESNLRSLFIEELGWDRYGERIQIPIGVEMFHLEGIAHKRDFAVFRCAPATGGGIPPRSERLKIDRALAKLHFQHIIIYSDEAQTIQVWQWVKREAGKPAACREHTYWRQQTGESLIQKLQHIAFSLAEEEELNHIAVTVRTGAAFDVERVTKRFYERFRAEHAAFLEFIKGIPDEEMQRWYASVMINRLMFNYFIQKKGFLNADHNYLKTKLGECQRVGRDRYYTGFLCPLFFEGFAKKSAERSAAANRLLGQVPYLNGGLFQKHQIEELHGAKIQIGDAAFERIFQFFELYQWHLDERPNRRDDEINPDVLGYIFEKYINQKQMGAYYTKEDITGYIAKNTIVPFLFDAARKDCAVAFKPNGSVWVLLKEDPDRYIYDAMKKGAGLDLPVEIAAGLSDVSMRGSWNKPAPPEFALPTEIWREVVARRGRYEEVQAKMACGQVQSINDLITCNLDIRQFAQDVIENCEGPELLRAFFHAIERVSVLDPTCGSGAFLFAALNVLEPLYEACLDRMQAFLDDMERSGQPHRPEKFSDFRKVLEQAARHPNRKYFILKSIVINNLYGVDIMEEAVEICKLRLFLKLVAQVEQVSQIEPLPDIDFNIRAGNTLVGYATYEDVKRAVGSKFDFEGALERIEEKAQDVERLFGLFRKQQTELGGSVAAEDKQALRRRLAELEEELNWHLAGEYGAKKAGYQGWLATHQPFHWFIDFHAIMSSGGFDAIIGNPPYLEKSKLGGRYAPMGLTTTTCPDIYSWVVERCLALKNSAARLGLIVPVSIASSGAFDPLRDALWARPATLWLAHFANRPGQLFEGAQNRLTIMLHAPSADGSATAFSTRYHRWDAKRRERDDLFGKIQYQYLGNSPRSFHGVFPKVGDPCVVSVLAKMQSTKTVAHYLMKSAEHPVYWVRVPGYFCQFYLEPPSARPEGGGPPRPRGELNSISVANARQRRVLHAILNSTAYYVFFCVHTDGRHINPSDVREHPLDLGMFSPPVLGELDKLSKTLEESLNANVSLRRKTGLLIESYDSGLSKRILDDIDRVLGDQYGFTAEELDFIVNYDIKYRLGRDAEETDGDGE
ncbi:MAG: DNA methyltransferase [Bryobacteraceae bacterium]|jgi:hypothetical protein